MRNKKIIKTKYNSLKRVVARTILFGAFFFLILAMALEVLLLIFSTMESYKREVDHDANYIMAILDTDYLEDLFHNVQDIYYNTPEEIRHQQNKQEYVDKLLPLLDNSFNYGRYYLYSCRETTEMSEILIFFYDEEYDRMVSVLDGNEGNAALLPGQWLSDENGSVDHLNKIKKIDNSNWIMTVGYGKVSGWTATNYDSIYDSNGDLMGYMLLTVPINSLVDKITLFLLIFMPVTLLIIIYAMVKVASFLDTRFLSPISRLSDAAAGYANISSSQYQEGTSLFKSLNINSGDEFESLWETMVNMEGDIYRAMNQIKESAAKEERIATELDVARSIQMDALPSVFPPFPDIHEFEIYANMTPAKEIGGDFYDFFMIDDNHLGMAIADVSGKGVPAALFMMISKRLLKSRAMNGGKPSEVLRYLNDRMCEENSNTMFVTVWFGILDITNGEIIAASAGHEYPFITDETGKFHMFKDPHGIMIGALEDQDYEDYTMTIPKDGKLFVYTDGVAEAQNMEETLFGLDRIGENLNKLSEQDPQSLIEGMHQAIDAFEEGAEQFDDITMLCVEFSGK